tara:strand:- start:990 stop:1469 length:480 start_codon:yes stop_codon:yes gene_type:complete
MLDNLKLTKNPVHHQQPCSMSCVPTCLAMAFDVEPEEIIDDMAEMGIDISNGMTSRAEHFYLSRKGIGSERFLNNGCVGLLSGHYLAQVPSLNVTGFTHCVYLYIDSSYEMTALDPNMGKKGLAFYSSLLPRRLNMISATRLDDFSDLIKPTPPTEDKK